VEGLMTEENFFH